MRRRAVYPRRVTTDPGLDAPESSDAPHASAAPDALDVPDALDESAVSEAPDAREAPDLLRLDEQVCFALAVASRTVVAMYGPHLAPLGITHPQYLVMLALWEEAPRHQGELARIVRLEPATLSPLLTRLEKIGYVQRVASSEDARVRLVGLTDAGRDVRRQAEAIPEAILADLDMDIEELATLRDSLNALIVRAESAADQQS